MKKAKLEYYRTNSKGDWRWRVRAANGRIIGASTEGYRRLLACKANARQLGQVLVQLEPCP